LTEFSDVILFKSLNDKINLTEEDIESIENFVIQLSEIRTIRNESTKKKELIAMMDKYKTLMEKMTSICLKIVNDYDIRTNQNQEELVV
jgi:hypothetical protein